MTVVRQVSFTRLSSHGSGEQKDAQQATYEREYAGKVEAELPETCDRILELKDKNSVSSTSAGESNELHFKTKGDYYQDLAKSVTGDAKRKVPVARPYTEYVDVPCANPIVQTVEKTVEVPLVQYMGEIVDESVVMQGQVPTTQTVQKTVEVSQVQFPDRVADIPVVSQRQVPDPLIREEIVEVMPLTRTCDETAELNDDHKKSYEQFVKCVKLEIRENSVDDLEIAELLRFNTSKSGVEQISFKEYVDRMKEGQNDIYYITGESIAAVSSRSFRENLRRKGYEVLLHG